MAAKSNTCPIQLPELKETVTDLFGDGYSHIDCTGWIHHITKRTGLRDPKNPESGEWKSGLIHVVDKDGTVTDVQVPYKPGTTDFVQLFHTQAELAELLAHRDQHPVHFYTEVRDDKKEYLKLDIL